MSDTYELVRSLFGADQVQRARGSIRSLQDRRAFAAFHYREAMRLTRAFERKHLKDNILLDLHGQDSERKLAAFNYYILRAGAHTTATVQSIHALPDILAHALYFSSGASLGRSPLPERQIDVPRVVYSLRQEVTFRPLASLLASSQKGNPWAHLAAVANLSKHRTVVRTSLSEDWSGTRPKFRELHVASFVREGKSFPSVSMQSLVDGEFHRLSQLIVECGHELNACLRRIAA